MPVHEVAPWPPTRYSAPLTADFDSLFSRYRDVFRIAWYRARGYCLDEWQETLLHHVTELTPLGHLRHRQFLISVARQNGKTEIAAALGLLFLLHKVAPYVIGIASSAEQARLVYDRAMTVIRGNAALSARFDRLTETRGIVTKSGGRWEIKAAKSAALQGIPVDLGVVDEVHITKAELWDDLVNGTGGRIDAMVVGITTAGNEDSLLLARLYEEAKAGRIGFAIWESETSEIPDDDAEFGRLLCQASPALACGRVDLQTVIADARTQPPASVIRYRLNRFVAGSDNGYLDLARWLTLAGEVTPPRAGVIFAIDRTPSWSHASVTAAWQVGEVVETQVVASVANPTLEALLHVCLALANRSRLFVVDARALGSLGDELKARGLAVRKATLGDHCAAVSRLYARVQAGTVRHAGDPLLTDQIPRTRTKAVGDQYRLTRATQAAEIDTVVGAAMAVYFVEAAPDHGSQLFIG